MLSDKSLSFRRTISPIRQIMDYADPAYFKKIGVEASEVISFAGGWVNHKAPSLLQKAYQEIVSNEASFHMSGGYSATLGSPECKKAIIRYESHLYGTLGLEPQHIAIGASSTQLTFNLMQVLLNPGDKVALLDPSYCNLPSQVTTALDVEVVRFPVIDTERWEYVADRRCQEFYDFILQERPKVVLLVSPDNPTSQVLSDDFVASALRAVKEVGSFLIVDFAYKDMVFDENLPEYFSWKPDDHFLTIHSNSKWSRSLGRRLGWIEASSEIVHALESIQGSSILCPDNLHQMALTKYLNDAIENNTLRSYTKQISEQYRRAGEHTVKAIKEYIGLPALTPKGGLYTCIKVGDDGAKFVEEVLKESAVLFVPGWGFGRTLSGAVRVSFGPLVNNLEVIEQGMKKVGEYLRRKKETLPNTSSMERSSEVNYTNDL